MRANFMIICYKDLDDGTWEIKHKCCYENRPEEKDIDSLQLELFTDQEFGMVDDDDYEMILVDRAEDTFWFDKCEIPEELN